MHVNELPHYDNSDNSDNETGCCPRFNPEGWDGAELHFKDKPFVRAFTRSAMHIPLDMGRVFSRVSKHITEQGADDPEAFIVLSKDNSVWNTEHLFSVTKPVASEDMTTLSGDFVTRVFEGPYREAKHWYAETEDIVRAGGAAPSDIYFFYTTCPKCAKVYAKNYVVGVARV